MERHGDASFLTDSMTFGLGPLEIRHPPGTFALTPASRIAVEALARHQDRFRGVGLDWGTGSGVLAILLARIPGVERVVGLEIEPANVRIARENAQRNGVDQKVGVFEADSYSPRCAEGRVALEALEASTDFLVANPPSSSPKDDGFGFRRAVMDGAGRYLRPGGIVCLSVSHQYGTARTMALLELGPTYAYGGVLASTEWVSFDMGRTDLYQDVETYAAEERRGGLPYQFRDPRDPGRDLTAVEAQEHYGDTGESPLSRWQSHLFVRTGVS